MIEISYQREDSGTWRGLQCSGHARFGEDEQADLVCAAVSALTGYLGLSLSRLFGAPGAVEAGPGAFRLTVPDHLSVQERFALERILDGVLLALQELEENYKGWVKVEPSV